jgi:CBS domain containing-hemolysin-like protein
MLYRRRGKARRRLIAYRNKLEELQATISLGRLGSTLLLTAGVAWTWAVGSEHRLWLLLGLLFLWLTGEVLIPLAGHRRSVPITGEAVLPILSVLHLCGYLPVHLHLLLFKQRKSAPIQEHPAGEEHPAPDPHKEDLELIHRLQEFRGEDIRNIMTPRPDMVTVPVETSLEEASRIASEQGFSRLPVFEGNRDNIVGVLHVKDLIPYWNQRESPPPLRKLVKKPYLVPETKHIHALLKEFQQHKVHMAIVLDEYGGTAGLVTLEDIMEEIFGEIHDEHDTEIPIPIRKVSEDCFEADARTRVDELNRLLPIPIHESPEYETVGGYLYSLIGRIPQADEEFTHDGLTFKVVSADPRRVKLLRIRTEGIEST